MMDVISEFTKEYEYLSNFSYMEVPIQYGLEKFYCVENAFQAAKYTGRHFDDIYHMFASLSPAQAKHLGRALQLREDWERVKDLVMEELLYQKFNNNPDLKQKLLATGDAILIEGNTWHDNYWGSCHCVKCGNKGKNKLGKILMKLRSEYRAV